MRAIANAVYSRRILDTVAFIDNDLPVRRHGQSQAKQGGIRSQTQRPHRKADRDRELLQENEAAPFLLSALLLMKDDAKLG